MSYLLDVLIPTFNRSSFLRDNLLQLSNQIVQNKLEHQVRLVISDNASTDNTLEEIRSVVEGSPQVAISIFTSTENFGLERNAVRVLQESDAEYVMFLGDDDYLPPNYLNFVVNQIAGSRIGYIIPAFSAVHPDGTVSQARSGRDRDIKASFLSVLLFSHYGHQLSGLTFRRSGVLNAYLKNERLRNIYLFVFFIAYSISRLDGKYIPSYKVLVTQGNAKDWSYDDSGLLTQVFRNYKALYPRSPVKQSLCSLFFISRHTWRLRIKNFSHLRKALAHIWSDEDASLLLKIMVPALVPFLYPLASFGKLKRFLINR